MDASAAGVSIAVRQAIRETQRKVVGVVLNAVDDHLTRADQLRLSWTVNQFHHLDTMLAEAQLVPRAVVLTSDHGHILEAGSVRLPGGENERWRAFSGMLAEAELVFEGPRVVAVTGERHLIAPWSETVRYSQKKHGYHGGATLQEVLVPIGVFTPPDHTLAGWEGLPDRKPMWWYRAEAPPTGAPTIPVRRTRRTKKSPTAQASLFAATEPQTDWIRSLAWVYGLCGTTAYGWPQGTRQPCCRDLPAGA